MRVNFKVKKKRYIHGQLLKKKNTGINLQLYVGEASQVGRDNQWVWRVRREGGEKQYGKGCPWLSIRFNDVTNISLWTYRDGDDSV